jgi:hypothetical protein
MRHQFCRRRTSPQLGTLLVLYDGGGSEGSLENIYSVIKLSRSGPYTSISRL